MSRSSGSQGKHRATPSRRWLLPALVVLVWVFVIGPLGSFAGKLAEVQENDNAAFLPQTAESTLVLEELIAFTGEESTPATVVFERTGGLTREDRRTIADYAEQLGGVEAVDAAGIGAPVFSEDGEAAQLVVPVTATDGEEIEATVGELREVLADPPEGLTALVGGQGGILGDFIEAFGAIDGLLLGVALLVVLVILLIVYRSPVLPLIVLTTSVLALGLAAAIVYLLADTDVLDLNGQSQGILFILAIGAATDYSLLLVARFREELRDTESRYDAMRIAWKRSLEPILASGVTVILGLLCLLLSDLTSLQGLGPVGAIGVVAAMLAVLTLLPAALLLLGRAAYWPFRPAYGSEHPDVTGVWGRVSRLVGRRARAVWVITLVVLAGFAAFVPTLDEDPVPQTELFLTEVDSVAAQDVLDAHFEADTASPATILVPEDQLQPVLQAVATHPGVAADGVSYFPAGPPTGPGPPEPKIVEGNAAESTATVEELRADLDEISTDVLVGGTTAIQLDTRETTGSDRAKVIPSILLVTFVVLALLLRSLAAPALLLLANVISFGATIGIAALLFNHVFDFPASDPSTTLIGFVFLVALGIDYSIFLMTRVREESIKQGTHPGVLKGLSVTGGVITSAGVVLAATFAALGVVPILFLAQIAFIVSFGVLLDTLVVRSLLVPALSYDLGPRIWWPSRLWHTPDHPDAETRRMLGEPERREAGSEPEPEPESQSVSVSGTEPDVEPEPEVDART
jgi:RND superfamily putative drug exporter